MLCCYIPNTYLHLTSGSRGNNESQDEINRACARKRYVKSIITFGHGCGVGVSTVASGSLQLGPPHTPFRCSASLCVLIFQKQCVQPFFLMPRHVLA